MSEKTFEILKEFQWAIAKLNNCYIWSHFKGGTYQVLDIQFDATKDCAVYAYRRIAGPAYDESLEKDIIFTRTVEEWFSFADPQKTVKRFTRAAKS